MARILLVALTFLFMGFLSTTQPAQANDVNSELHTASFSGGFGCPAQGCSPPGTGRFGCPAQGCSPPGTGGRFGCPAQGCSPPGTGRFGCPAQGCSTGLNNPPRIIYSTSGTRYDYVSNGTYRDSRTGQLVRVLSYVNGYAYLSNGQYVSIPQRAESQPVPRSQPSAEMLTSGAQVKVLTAGPLQVGSDVVGQYSVGEVYVVHTIQNGWFSLKDKNGELLPGWALITNFAVVK